jgi:hypothetical protein
MTDTTTLHLPPKAWCLGCCEINAGNVDAHGADLHNDAAMFRDLKRKDLWLFKAIYGIGTFEALLIGNYGRLASISIIFEWLTSFQWEAARNTRHAVASPYGGTPEQKAALEEFVMQLQAVEWVARPHSPSRHRLLFVLEGTRIKPALTTCPLSNIKRRLYDLMVTSLIQYHDLTFGIELEMVSSIIYMLKSFSGPLRESFNLRVEGEHRYAEELQSSNCGRVSNVDCRGASIVEMQKCLTR